MELQKPYDGHALVEALKKEGLEGGLGALDKSVSVLADFLRSSALLSKDGIVGHLDDFLIPVINLFEKLAKEKIEAVLAQVSAPVPLGDGGAIAASSAVVNSAPVADPAPAVEPAPVVASPEVAVETPKV